MRIRITARYSSRRRLPCTVCQPKRAGLYLTSHTDVADRDSQDGGSNLAQRAFQALGGFLQLPLESVDLLRYIIKLFFSQRACSRNLLNSAVRFAHGGPNFHRNTSEAALFWHREPPL